MRGRALATGFLSAYRGWTKLRARGFAALASGSFGSFGAGSVVHPPVRLRGERRISVGRNVVIGPGSWLEVLDRSRTEIALEIGDGTSIVGSCTVIVASSVRVGQSVLMARNVYIADHMHAFEDPRSPVLDQGITRIGRVEIEDGAWLGQNVVVGPGVRIGRGAVIGANAVVMTNVPDYAVAAGVPAKILRRFVDENAQRDLEA